MTTSILQIDSSIRAGDSVSRALTDRIVARFQSAGGVRVARRDLGAAPLPTIDAAWTAANFTPRDERTEDQRRTLALSDRLIDEARQADVLVIGVPVYNFSVPAGLKAWIDLVARAGETFRYTEAGPEGLLTGKRAILAFASGGTPIGSDVDFATGYLKHVLNFLGIAEVEIVAADRIAVDADATLRSAEAAVDALPLAA